MAIKEVFDSAGLDLGMFSFGFNNFLYGFIMFLLAVIVLGGGVYFLTKSRQYNKTIHIFEEVNGQTIPSGEDKAKLITLPNTSVGAYYLKKRKVYIPRPSIQTSKGHYWYFIRDDGEWINVGLTNLNRELKELGLRYDHTDMRMANASLKKLVEKNYKKLNWLKEYAPYIAIAVLILMLGIVAFLVLNKTNDLIGTMGSFIDKLSQLDTTATSKLEALDNLCSASGIRTVT